MSIGAEKLYGQYKLVFLKEIYIYAQSITNVFIWEVFKLLLNTYFTIGFSLTSGKYFFKFRYLHYT